MKKLMLLLLLVSLFACKHDGTRTVIKGEIEKCKEKYLFFQEITVKGDGVVDSTSLSSSGSFKIVKYIQTPAFYMLWTKGQKPLTVVALPGEKIKIEGLADSLFYNYKVSGSEESKRAQIIKLMLDRTLNKLDSLNKVYKMFLNNPNIAQIKETLTNNYNRCIDEQREFTIMFLEQNPTSITNIIALYQQVDPQTNTFVLYKDEDFKYFDKTDSLLFKKYPTCPHVLALHANVNEMRQQQNKLKVQKLLSAMGAQAPDIALPSPNGDTVRLSSLKGKIVLLDFWASWCPPCRQENPNLVDIYAKYKSLGFEIYQVSLDKSKDAWTKAIREDKLNWYHVSDLKYWDSPAAKLYNIESIPASFLIDRDGSIIARNLLGDALDDRLKDLLIK